MKRMSSLMRSRSGRLSLSFALCILASLIAERSNAAPRIVDVSPRPGGHVPELAGIQRVTITCDKAVSVPSDAVSAFQDDGVPVPLLVEPGLGTDQFEIVFPGTMSEHVVTVIIDYSVTSVGGEELDGEVDDPDGATLPTGDGVRGGQAVLRFNVLKGDINHDGVVDTADLGSLLMAFNAYDAETDLNGDGVIDTSDLGGLLGSFGSSIGYSPGFDSVVESITPDPSAPLDTELEDVVIDFSAPIDPLLLDLNAVFAVDSAGAPIPASAAFFGADPSVVTFRFSPPLPACSEYEMRFSRSIASHGGGLLDPPVGLVYDGLAPPPPPMLSPVDQLTTAASVAIAGAAPRATSVRLVAPSGVYSAQVVGGQFAFDVPLNPDELNAIFVTSVSGCGLRSAPSLVSVVRDVTGPIICVDHPTVGDEILVGAADVAGRLGDEFIGAMGLTLSVNGVSADVTSTGGMNGTFVARNVPIALGNQPLAFSASDALGNTSDKTVWVTGIAPTTNAKAEIIGGSGQTAPVGAPLPEPLVVKLTRGDGSPLAGKVVDFTIVRNDGTLSLSNRSSAPVRELQILTDSQGEASVRWTLGATAGAASDRVRVTSADVDGLVYFTANGVALPPSRILVGEMNDQIGEAGAPLTVPMIAYVTDGDSGNPIQGASVLFSVVRGGGNVTSSVLTRNFSDEVLVPTDASGRATAWITLGDEPGLNEVHATFLGNPGSPAVFRATGVSRIDETPTSYRGVVQDNAGRAIGGALAMLTVTVEFPTGPAMVQLGPVYSDVDGVFVFDASNLPPDALDTDLPAGPAKLKVSGVNATTLGGQPITREWMFPFVGLQFVLVPNTVNELPDPVWLPELDQDNEFVYDGTRDVLVTMDGVDGVEFLVRAGSLTREDGSKPSPSDPEVIRLNQVHFDEVPMPLPEGNAYPFAWTLQPKNARFSPPIEVTLPNATGLSPGTIMEILQWNNNLVAFQPMGTGRVSDDGAVIVSEPGSGITIAGWGGGAPPPPPTGGTGNCPGNPLVETALAAGSFITGLVNIFVPVNEWITTALDCFEAGFDCTTAGRNFLFDGNLSNEEIESLRDCVIPAKSCVVGIATNSPLGRLTKPGDLLSNTIRAVDAGVQLLKTTLECLFGIEPPEALETIARQTGFLTKLDKLLTSANLVDQAEAVACQGFITLGDYLMQADENDPNVEQELSQLLQDLEEDLLDYEQALQDLQDAIEDIEQYAGQAIDDAESIEGAIPHYPELAGCQIRLGGETVTADANGGWSFDGVVADGSLVRCFITCPDAEGGPQYAVTPYFYIVPDQTIYFNDPFTFTPSPPLNVVALEFSIDNDQLEPGQTAQATTIGVMSDGSTVPLQTISEGTIYRSSNPSVITVSDTGEVTATGPGLAFVTAINEGVSASVRVTVTRQAEPVTVAGIVMDETGSPVINASVTTLPWGGNAITDANGVYSLTLSLPEGARGLTPRATAPDGRVGVAGVARLRPGIQLVDGGIAIVREAATGELFQRNAFAIRDTQVRELELGDFDGDNDLDVAATGHDALHIGINDGTGRFTFDLPPINYNSNGSNVIRSGDVTGDGINDLVIVEEFLDSVLVYQGLGSGGFGVFDADPGPGGPALTTELRPVAAGLADMNGDDALDLIIANQGSKSIEIFLNDGFGQFQKLPGVNIGDADESRDLIIADIDGDEILDIAIEDLLSNSFVVIPGNGDGTLQIGSIWSYPLQNGTVNAMASADLDGVNGPDLVVCRRAPNSPFATSLWVYLNTGTGLAASPVDLGEVNGGGEDLLVDDFNNDGFPDLAIPDDDKPTEIWINQGDGLLFDRSEAFAIGTSSESSFESGDLNGDGFPEIAEVNSSIPVYSRLRIHHNSSGGFGGGARLILEDEFVSSLRATADFNQDNHDDILLYGYDDGPRIYVALADGLGGFDQAESVRNQQGLKNLVCADADGDLDPDIAFNYRYTPAGTTFSGTLVIENAVDSWQSRTGIAFQGDDGDIEFEDLTGDGIRDLIACNNAASITVFPLAADGAATTPTFTVTDSLPYDEDALHRTADLDLDGDLDIVTTRNTSIYSLYNDGGGSLSLAEDDDGNPFTPPPGVKFTGDASGSVALGDMDGDGVVDVVSSADSYVGVLIGDGAGDFADIALYESEHAFTNPRLVDLDGDGDLDVVMAGSGKDLFGIMRNDGYGVLSNSDVIVSENTNHEPVLVDIDADGDLDILNVQDGVGVFAHENLWKSPDRSVPRVYAKKPQHSQAHGARRQASMALEPDQYAQRQPITVERTDQLIQEHRFSKEPVVGSALDARSSANLAEMAQGSGRDAIQIALRLTGVAREDAVAGVWISDQRNAAGDLLMQRAGRDGVIRHLILRADGAALELGTCVPGSAAIWLGDELVVALTDSGGGAALSVYWAPLGGGMAELEVPMRGMGTPVDILGINDQGEALIRIDRSVGNPDTFALGFEILVTHPADLDADGIVDQRDIRASLRAVQGRNAALDLTGDGRFDAEDVGHVIGAYGVQGRILWPQNEAQLPEK